MRLRLSTKKLSRQSQQLLLRQRSGAAAFGVNQQLPSRCARIDVLTWRPRCLPLFKQVLTPLILWRFAVQGPKPLPELNYGGQQERLEYLTSGGQEPVAPLLKWKDSHRGIKLPIFPDTPLASPAMTTGDYSSDPARDRLLSEPTEAAQWPSEVQGSQASAAADTGAHTTSGVAPSGGSGSAAPAAIPAAKKVKGVRVGQWRQAKTAEGEEYWYHAVTKETRWDAPPPVENEAAAADAGPKGSHDAARGDARWDGDAAGGDGGADPAPGPGGGHPGRSRDAASAAGRAAADAPASDDAVSARASTGDPEFAELRPAGDAPASADGVPGASGASGAFGASGAPGASEEASPPAPSEVAAPAEPAKKEPPAPGWYYADYAGNVQARESPSREPSLATPNQLQRRLIVPSPTLNLSEELLPPPVLPLPPDHFSIYSRSFHPGLFTFRSLFLPVSPQGPFDVEHLRSWRGHLPMEIPVWRIDAADTEEGYTSTGMDSLANVRTPPSLTSFAQPFLPSSVPCALCIVRVWLLQ